MNDADVNLVREKIWAYQPGEKYSVPAGASRPTEFLNVSDPCSAVAEYATVGRQLLLDGRVGVLMLAGGISQRMSHPGLRGNLPVCPLSNHTIFRIHGAKIAALDRRCFKQSGRHIPWLVLASEEVKEETEATFRKEDYFGLDARDVTFLVQPSLPVLGEDMEPVIDPSGVARRHPTGHGGLIEALRRKKDALDRLDIEHVFCFIYPNVLERILDPVMLGYHATGGRPDLGRGTEGWSLGGFEFTTKGISNREYAPGESLGRIVSVGGSLQIVEYRDVNLLDDEMQFLWNTVPASTATHVWSVPFLKRCRDYPEEVRLLFHPICKGGVWHVEQYVFDLLPHAKRSGLVLVPRAEQYYPVKTPDDLPRARQALAQVYRRLIVRQTTWGDFLTGDY